MRLTPEGEVLYQHVAQACEQIAIGEKKIQAMLHLDWGSIHIGSSDMIMHAFLLPYLERFHKDYPKVRISTITASTPETIASLRALPDRSGRRVFASGRKRGSGHNPRLQGSGYVYRG